MHAQGRLGRYLVQALLGEGGMGAVYRAHDTVLERPVALKVLRADVDSQDEDRARLLREAQAIARLDHPNIVRVYDVAEIDGSLCIAMELVEGASLRELQQTSDYSLEERLAWLLDTARALTAAHAAGIVHRDLKPDNVMLRDDGVLKVLDFGIATLVRHDDALVYETATDDGDLVGTPAYMSPEQLSRLPVDGRADQFAWGVMAFELLTGQLPWGEGDLLQTLTAVLKQDPPSAASLTPGLGSAVSEVIDRALRKDPAERFVSMARAADALVVAATGLSANIVPPAADLALSLAPTRRAGAPISASPNQPSASRRVWLGAAVALAVVAMLAALWMRRPRVTPAGAPAASSSSAPVARAITDLPDPESHVPEARAAYRRYLVAFRQGERGLDNLKRAIDLDPEFTAAHMRLALRSYTWQPDQARVHAAKAMGRRGRMSERDQHLVDMLQPLVMAQPRDAAGFLEVARQAVAAFPEDAELHWMLGWAHGLNAQFERARGAFLRATELDPGFAWGWQYLAESLAGAGQLEAARSHVDACLEKNPVAQTCRLIRVLLDSEAGRCDDVLADIDQMLLARPDDSEAIERKSYALVALGQPQEAVDAIVARLKRVAADDPLRIHRHQAKLLAYRGDFEGSMRALDEWEAVIADSSFEVKHSEVALLRASLLLETKDDAGARELADQYFRKRAAWVPDPRRSAFSIATDVRPLLWEIRRRQGDPEAVVARSKWRDAIMTEGARVAQFAWLHADVAFVSNRDEARAILARMPNEGPPSYGPLSPIRALVGHLLLHAGETGRAVEELELAVRDYRRFKHPFVHARAIADLGAAYEAVGDDRACSTYASLLARWAPDKSATATRVAERIGVLGCPGTPVAP